MNPLPLEYASSDTQQRWGKIIIRPSRLTLFFLLPLALSIIWLIRHHEPWRMAAALINNETYEHFPLITPDGRLLCDNRSAGLATIDLETGQVVTPIVPPSKNPTRHFIPIGNGDRVLDASGSGPTMTVYSTATGKPLAELPNPQSLNPAMRTYEISTDTKRLVAGVAPEIYLWDISGDKPTMIGFVGAENPNFTNDQKRIFACKDNRVVIFDANNGWLIHSASWGPKTVGLDVNSGTFALADGAGPTEFHSIWNASVINTCPPPTIKKGSRISWSQDLKWLFVESNQPAPLRGGVGFANFDIVDSASGTLNKRITYPGDKAFVLFPDCRRYLLTDRRSIEIHDVNHDDPIAVLRLPDVGYGYANTHIAPDGQTLFVIPNTNFTNGRDFFIYRRAGWDCPESTWGLLAFPSTWLLTWSLIAAALSLMRDARRQADSSTSPWFLYPFWAITLLLTIHVTIEACRGVAIKSPAPLLLIAACALASGSRAWKWIAIVLLAHTLAWCAMSLSLLQKVQENTYPLFDRTYPLSQKLRLNSLTVTTLGIIIAIIALVIMQRPRHRSQ